MHSLYPDFSKIESHALLETEISASHALMLNTAVTLLRARAVPSRLSPLVFMTDPIRVPDIFDAVKSLPRGTAVIYRHFGDPKRQDIAQTLRSITQDLGHQFLIGDDPDLALRVMADGVHFRRDAALIAPREWRKKKPNWLISMAGIKDNYLAYSEPLSCLDGLFVSSVFPSQSPSAGTALGLEKFDEICQMLAVAVFALGGVNRESVEGLRQTKTAGFAAIDGLTLNQAD